MDTDKRFGLPRLGRKPPAFETRFLPSRAVGKRALRVSRGFGPTGLLGSALIMLAFAVGLLAPQQSQALPSYARQTGLGCGVCHTEFPQLAPFGRRFKIGGYTLRKPEDKRIDATPRTPGSLGTPDWELPSS